MQRASIPTIPKWLFVIILLVLLALRFLHFGEKIDSPHAWRQCDTAQYAWSFYQEGIDLFHPSVCWMGDHKTLLLECPLPEAVVAGLYHLFGPSHIVSRAFYFFGFIFTLLFFYLLIQKFSSDLVARLATILFAVLPISLFFSRAHQIDFWALALSFGMAWSFVKGLQSQKWLWYVLGGLFAIPAFLIKAPYAFYLALPLAWFALRDKNFAGLFRIAILSFPALLLFGLWVWHSQKTNALAPDWDFIPGYHKFTERAGWYFGPLNQRWVGDLWVLLGKRFLFEVAGIAGCLMALGGLTWARERKGYIFALLWFIGTVIYLLIFFNLNTVHNYYQIPFLAPFALFMALFLEKLLSKFSKPAFQYAILTLLLLIPTVENIRYAEVNYFRPVETQIKIGESIKQKTQPDDLVVVSWGGLDSRCPNLLYRARRYGWSIPARDLSASLCVKLFEEGADYLALVRYSPPEGEMHHFTQILPTFQPVEVQEDGLKLFLFQLDSAVLVPPKQ